MVKIASDNRRGWARVSAHSSVGTMGGKMEREKEREMEMKRDRERRQETIPVCVRC